MKNRLLIVVLFLVILPTVVLTLMAGHSLRNREALLQYRLESNALAAVNSVAKRLETRLEDDLDIVTRAVSDCLASGGGPADIEGAVAHLRESHPLMSRVYLFMNPWGFIHPDMTGDSLPAQKQPGGEGFSIGDDERLNALVQVLRREIGAVETWDATVCVAAGGGSYCFRRLGVRRSLYAGLRIDMPGLVDFLADSIDAFSGGGFELAVEGLGESGGDDESAAGDDTVVVRDSLDPRQEEVSFPDLTSGHSLDVGRLVTAKGRVVARRRLSSPLAFVIVSAVLADPEVARRESQLRSRLYGWGIFLVVVVILIGSALVLREASREIREARSRSDFVIGVSHDLRTPVASMKMLSESLLLGHVTDEGKKEQFLRTIVRECDRLSQLVERVLFFVRFGQNALVCQPVTVDPRELVDDAVQSFRARLGFGVKGRRHVTTTGQGPQASDPVTVNVEAGIPAVDVDVSGMTQVLLNLLDNAWKYSQGAEGQPAIVLGLQMESMRGGLLRPKSPWLAISVADNGIGIYPAEMRKIFRRFYRSRRAMDANLSGVGLGLALCRHIVRSHGGMIRVQSTPGAGSIFTVYLPVSRSEAVTGSH